MSFLSKLQKGWNAFLGRDPTYYQSYNLGNGYSRNPGRATFTKGVETSLVTAVYNRIAVDVAKIDFEHVKLDENGRYKETVLSGLNNCLTLDANLDQTGRALIQDIVISMLDDGAVAVVPTDAKKIAAYEDITADDILTLRAGRVVEWYPHDVKVRLYNERNGQKEEIICHKWNTAIIQNPFYAVMNEPNSTLRRLIRKLVLLDQIDERAGSNKLDLIIQLPYTTKTSLRQQQAKERLNAIKEQLAGNEYGVAYIDGTEHITQLNRPVENNLQGQIEYLMKTLYAQLSISQSIMDGTADERAQLNYTNNTLEPIAAAIANELKRKFLTPTARTQGQSIMFMTDPFRLLTVTQLPEVADKLVRNEIATKNEIRQLIGWKPALDPSADTLSNPNISKSKEEFEATPNAQTGEAVEGTANAKSLGASFLDSI